MIKIICGYCGTSKGVLSAASGTVELPKEEEKYLVRRGVARFVCEESTETGKIESFEETQGNCTSGTEACSCVDFEAMTVKELAEYASDNGIDVSGCKRKTDIIEAIENSTNFPKVCGEDSVV